MMTKCERCGNEDHYNALPFVWNDRNNIRCRPCWQQGFGIVLTLMPTPTKEPEVTPEYSIDDLLVVLRGNNEAATLDRRWETWRISCHMAETITKRLEQLSAATNPVALIQRVTGELHGFADDRDAQEFIRTSPPAYWKEMSVRSYTFHPKGDLS